MVRGTPKSCAIIKRYFYNHASRILVPSCNWLRLYRACIKIERWHIDFNAVFYNFTNLKWSIFCENLFIMGETNNCSAEPWPDITGTKARHLAAGTSGIQAASGSVHHRKIPTVLGSTVVLNLAWPQSLKFFERDYFTHSFRVEQSKLFGA